ncbi:MAG: 2-amino-4-hydroxy-6-hydroxymethyldihydropteridine diphosphokinase, partial [Bacteroidales bacterium]|nr:2-amino-4-hydroxy-6-hydroxymethyldihydropteridine diphosphokinase [Bacteroidales bacterium]
DQGAQHGPAHLPGAEHLRPGGCRGRRAESDRPAHDAAFLPGVIDIDILFLGKEKINTRKLTIPHKGIANRPFVMIPLLEIAEPSVKESFPEIFQNTRK